MRFPLSGVVRDDAGNIVPSATVDVFLSGTTTPATLYAAASGGSAISGVTADTGGRFLFYVDEDDYTISQRFKIVITSDTFTATTVDPLVVSNMIEGHVHDGSTFDCGTLTSPNNTLKIRYGTAAQLASVVLEEGELGWATDTSTLRVGDSVVAGGVAPVIDTAGGFVLGAEGFYAGSGSTRVQMKPGVGIWAGATAYNAAPFYVSCAGAMTANSGTIGGWIVTTGLIKSAVSAERIELDQALMRITIKDATDASKVVMGYLHDLAKHDGSGYWGPADYGFWVGAGDHLVIDGDVIYESGDWLVENDGSFLVQNAQDQTIIRLGTDTGEKGLFLYNASGTLLAKFVTDEVLIGNSGGQHLSYTVAGGLEIAGTVTVTQGDINASDITNDLGWTTDESLDAFIAGTYASDIAYLYQQVDGVVYNWFYEGEPTLANAPAVSWNTNQLKTDHLGDMYYDLISGFAYRFVYNAPDYSWLVVPDTGVAEALAAAAAAQDTADNKRRVFVATPTTPYEIGDLWSAGPTGELKRCKTTRLTGAYQSGDWELASKYTDDTTANTAVQAAAAAAADATASLALLSNIASDTKVTPVEKLAIKPHWLAIVAEATLTTGSIPVQAAALGVSDSTFDNAYLNLYTYIVTSLGLFNDMTATTIVVRATWDANWKAYYDARTALLNAFVTKAATLATWQGVTGANKPADNATVGAIWGTNLTNIPTTLSTPAGNGLYLSSTYMGYYSGGVWQSYMRSNGTWYFKGDGTHYINWDGANLFVQGGILAGSMQLGDGTTTSGRLTLNITEGLGDCYINSGKTDFTNVQSGFILGLDDSDSNKAKFFVGDASTYLNWDGSNLTIGGSIINTGNIIVNSVTNVQSTHVESFVVVESGSGNTDWRTAATISITSTGAPIYLHGISYGGGRARITRNGTLIVSGSSGVMAVDTPVAGTYTYNYDLLATYNASSNETFTATEISMVGIELKR